MKDDPHDLDDQLPSSTKRKMEDTILLAKQKAQEIAARLVSNASDSKRTRLDDSPDSVPYSNTASFPVPFVPQTGHYDGSQPTNKRISIPTGKVGLIIGKGGETIKYLQSQAGAKIQITKDLEADPHSRTRDVELMGTPEQISRAEELINDMILQSETASSGPSTNQAANPVQPGGEQLILKVPNNKVALIIGKGGESIRTMQARSGARIQIIPLHLPPGDTSAERNVYIDGLPDQIEAAKELVNEVISGKRLVNPTANSYGYPSAGNWVAPGQQSQPQQPHYGYTQPGGYAQPPSAASYYSNYPGTGWDQSNQAAQQTAGYSYYGQSNPSYGYNQSYSQQPSSYGQPNSAQAPAPDQSQQYPGSGYGAPSNSDGSSQNTQPSSAYSYADYSQPMANPQGGYWAYPSNAGQPPAQQLYDQSGYYQAAYGGQQPQSGYGEDGQSVPAAADHGQPLNPAQEVPPTNGLGHSSVNGTQRSAGGNSDGNGSASVVQETGDAQAEVGGS